MHPWLAPWWETLVLVHVVAAFLFVLFHGPSSYAMWQLRREEDPARVGALLDLSIAATPGSWISLAALTATGAALAGARHAWAEPWAWGSAVVLLGAGGAMSFLAARPFNEARVALGLRWFDGKRVVAATGEVDRAALSIALARIRARAPSTVAIGLATLALLVWLMVARPG